MKKNALIIAFLLVFSISVFAGEGVVPIGGRTCPNGQTTCLVNNEQTEPSENDNTTTEKFINIFDFLKTIFEF